MISLPLTRRTSSALLLDDGTLLTEGVAIMQFTADNMRIASFFRQHCTL